MAIRPVQTKPTLHNILKIPFNIRHTQPSLKGGYLPWCSITNLNRPLPWMYLPRLGA
uniref:Uncharacterized protein n=1 Tax=Triticum urartu TaxID=4572 RepID=A0A8R7QNP2_TRIUA